MTATGSEPPIDTTAPAGVLDEGAADPLLADPALADVDLADVDLADVGPSGVGLGEVDLADAGLADAAHVMSDELHRKSLTRRLVEALVSITALAVLFLLVFPKVTGSTYRDVGHELSRLSVAQIGALTLVWAAGLVVYAGVLTAVLPGLRRPQAVVLNTATSAVSNVVPFGGAVGVGATYGICRSWGFGLPATTLGILVSGIWNVFLKLGLPIVAVALLVVAGQGRGGLAVAAGIGLAVLTVGVVLLVLVLRSERLAGAIGRAAPARAISWARRQLRRDPATGVEKAVLDFRVRSSGLIGDRWPRITFWMLGYSLMQFLLLLLILRMLGESSIATLQVFAAFAFGRLLSTIPITPSGVGFADAGTAASLIAFGGEPAVCAAAVLLFTGFVYVLEIPVGGLSWIVWTRARGWRHPVATEPALPAP